MCCRKDLAQTSNSLISNTERI
ncbi:hypothetical protein F383_35870 [Gossypium arboreum]|uniref:Uncharacterized protein n=1 Tax=Gossypium arboreum TaxID=29729 RepID=A0A0B0N9K4_GOSAR|nr:hypothetical protein F383_35870 [Gossypium arboreum]